MNGDQELKSLKRGLKALALLNQKEIVTISELAREMNLPRTTAERILGTLASEGFVERPPKDKHYRLTAKVCSLSAGFSDESWISHVASPLLFDMTQRIGWPLAIATPFGQEMTVRLTTDPATSLWLTRRRIGASLPILQASSGLVYLAFAPEQEREEFLAILSAPDQPQDNRVADLPNFRKLLQVIAADGYAFSPDAGRERSVALPIFIDGQIRAVLLMMYMSKAISGQTVIDTFIPELKALSAEFTRRVSVQRTGSESKQPNVGNPPDPDLPAARAGA